MRAAVDCSPPAYRLGARERASRNERIGTDCRYERPGPKKGTSPCGRPPFRSSTVQPARRARRGQGRRAQKQRCLRPPPGSHKAARPSDTAPISLAAEVTFPAGYPKIRAAYGPSDARQSSKRACGSENRQKAGGGRAPYKPNETETHTEFDFEFERRGTPVISKERVTATLRIPELPTE